VRPLQETEVSLGPAVPPARSRSALVVSHHLDGFLRTRGHGLVASRCQPWGSTRFAHPPHAGPKGPSRTDYPPRVAGSHPSKSSPPSTAAPHHCGPCTSCRWQARYIAVKLRSAEADPHVTRAEARDRCNRHSTLATSRSRASTCSFHPSLGTRCRVLRSVWSSQSTRLQGFAPLIESVVDRPPFPVINRSFLPWACVPFKVRCAPLQAVERFPRPKAGAGRPRRRFVVLDR